MKKKFLALFFIFLLITPVNADVPYYLDFKYVLNQSVAGKKAQDFLKNKFEKVINDLKKQEKSIQDEEKKIIQQKKIIKPEEYKSKVEALRNKVSKLQAQRSKLLESTANQRNTARKELLKNLNPIIKDYMKEKGLEW